MKYKNVVLTKRGGPEVLQVQEEVLSTPTAKEAQIKVYACGVGRTDVGMRYSYYPYSPKIPFVPGYEIVGKITAIGAAVEDFKVGDMVAALTVYGGYSEYIILDTDHLVPVPEGVRLDEAAAIILNYCTAYQMLHRVLKVKKGDTVLITGASGGVGTALLDLGKLAGLKLYGTAAKEKHHFIKEEAVIPLNYKSEDWDKTLMKMEPDGLDFVIDGIGGSYIKKGFSVLRKGGELVDYAFPSFTGMLWGLVKLNLLNLYPNGKKGQFYGISANYKKDKSSVIHDLKLLFDLLKEGKIKPILFKKYPILEAANANRHLESGSVFGKIVLVAPEID